MHQWDSVRLSRKGDKLVKFVGRRTEIGIAKESTRGTAVNPTFWMPTSTISFDEKVAKVRSEEGFGNIQEGSDSFITSIMGEGDFESEMRVDSLGLVLLSLFGSVSSAVDGGGGSAYDHTYTIANTNIHQSLSILSQDPVGDAANPETNKMMTLACVDSFKFTVNPEEIVKYTAGFKSRGAKDWTTQTADYTSDSNKLLHQHLTLKFAANIAGLSGASATSVKSFDIEIAKNTIHDNVAGTVQPEDILNQQFGVTGTIVLNHEDDTFKDFDVDNTYRSMEVLLTNPATIGNSANPQLQLQLPRVSFSEWERDRSLNDIVTQTIQFQGNYDATNALDVISTAVLTNETASY